MNIKDIRKKYSVETTGEFKTLELTDEQYRRLLLAISLGRSTVFNDDDGIDIALTDIGQYVQSYATTFNATDLVTHDPLIDFYFITDTLQDKTNEIIDYYDDNTFRFELTKRLAQRDAKLLEKTQGKKSIDEIEEIELKYLDEFIENDVENLQVIK